MAYDIPAELNRLRTRSGLSMAALAKALEMRNGSSWQHYESPDKYKKGYISVDLAEKLVKALVGKGTPPITREDVFRLTRPAGEELLNPAPSLIRPIEPINDAALNYAVRTVLRNFIEEQGGWLEDEDLSGLADRIRQAYGHVLDVGEKKRM